MSVFDLSFWKGWGSRSSDIPGIKSVENPLPPCPDSPNCIRITRKIDHPLDFVFTATSDAVKVMDPIKMNSSKEDYKVELVFRVFIFNDDMVLKLTEKDSSSTYLHIRSASRVGRNDFGVNSRRVKKFLQHLKTVSP